MIALLVADLYIATVFPQASLPGANLTFTLAYAGPLTEQTYCLGIEIDWPDDTTTKRIPDCPGYDDYIKSIADFEECSERIVVCPNGYTCEPKCQEPYNLQTRWTFTTRQLHKGFNSGSWNIEVRFLWAHKHFTRYLTFFVGGEGE